MASYLPPVSLWFPWVMAMLGLILASAFFSASETALFFLSHEELRSMRVGSARERLAASLLRRPDRLLTAVLFWNLVVNLAFFAVSVIVAQRLIAEGHRAFAATFGVVSLFGIILLGEVVPKSGAVVFRRSLASLVSIPLAVTVRILDPVTPVLGRMTLLARRAFWPHLAREPVLNADDLERAVEASELKQESILHERQVLHNVLDLSEISAEEIMRPRGTCLSLPAPIHLADLEGEVPESGYVLVQAADSEDVEQAIPLSEFSVVPELHLEQAAEDVVYVPWCANLANTLQLLRERFCGVAVVVNEYGETIGIVTYEDVIDTVLSPEPSRAKRLLHREPMLEVSPGNYHVEGITTLRYLCRRLNLEFEPSPDGVLTVAGMLHEELEHLPVVGDEIDWRGYRIKVIASDRPGQLRVLLSQRPPPGVESHSERRFEGEDR
jgi:CBS domain containing-hemolysin-like protein